MGLDLLGNTNRTNLGNMVPVDLFRALRLTGIHEGLKETLGRGANAIIYRGGLHVGYCLGQQIIQKNGSKEANSYLKETVEICKTLKIGLLSIEGGDLKNSAVVKVRECVTCSGIPNIGETVCHFEGGMIAGLFELLLSAKIISKEIECCGKGDSSCIFDLKIGKKE